MTERITLDLSGSDDATKDGEFPVLPKGWYKVAIYSSAVRRTKKDDKPYLNTRLNVTQEGAFYKRVVFDGFTALYTTEKAPFLAAKAEQLSRIAGLWDGQDRKQVVLPNPEDIQGLEVEAHLTVERDDYAEDKRREEEDALRAQGVEVEADETPLFRNSVRAYRPVGGWPSVEESAGGKKPAAKKGKTAGTISL